MFPTKKAVIAIPMLTNGKLRVQHSLSPITSKSGGVLVMNPVNALHLASFNGHLEIVKLLIQAGHFEAKEITSKGWSALHFASAGGHLDIVIYLVQVHVGTIANEGLTPWQLASENNRHDIVHYFAEGCKFDTNGATRVPVHGSSSPALQLPSYSIMEKFDGAMNELGIQMSSITTT